MCRGQGGQAGTSSISLGSPRSRSGPRDREKAELAFQKQSPCSGFLVWHLKAAELSDGRIPPLFSLLVLQVWARRGRGEAGSGGRSSLMAPRVTMVGGWCCGWSHLMALMLQ